MSGGLFGIVLLASGSLALGLCIGSFLNVVVHRLPLGQSLVFPGSHCPGCDHAIAPYDNIPVVSYLWLGGLCRHCETQISWRYPAVELLTGLRFLGGALRCGFTLETPLWMIFSAALVAAAGIDIDHQIIPDEISLGGLVFGLLAAPFVFVQMGVPLGDAVRHAVLGGLVGGGTLWVVGFAHARLSVAMGREFEHWPEEGEELPKPSSLDYWTWFPGLGFGDVKLLAMIGVFLGPVGVLMTILMASLVGLALGVGWGLATRSYASPFGFAPAIAAGALLVLLAPPSLQLFAL